MSDNDDIQPYQTLVGRLLIDQAFCQRLVLEPREAVAGAELVDVPEERLAWLEALTITERQHLVRQILGQYALHRWTGWWGWEMTDPEPDETGTDTA